MKKIILAAAVVCAAALSQAAAIQWGSDSAVYNDAGSKVSNTAKLYVYSLTEKQYRDSTKTAWDLVGADVLAGGEGKIGGGTSNQMTSKFMNVTTPGGMKNTDYFYAIVSTIGSGDSMKYIAEKVTVHTGEDGCASFAKVASAAYSAEGAKSAWQTAATPEPTSAMLLLLGMAGLALRRRKA